MSSFVAFQKQPPVGCSQQTPDCGKLQETSDLGSSIQMPRGSRQDGGRPYDTLGGSSPTAEAAVKQFHLHDILEKAKPQGQK